MILIFDFLEALDAELALAEYFHQKKHSNSCCIASFMINMGRNIIVIGSSNDYEKTGTVVQLYVGEDNFSSSKDCLPSLEISCMYLFIYLCITG